MSAATGPPATWGDMGRDVDLAFALAEGRPTGPLADEVRRRLRSYIEQLLVPAETYAKALEDVRARDIVEKTAEHARALLRDHGGDPATSLRLLGKATYHLMRYASALRPGPQR
ncbi:DUF6415 family natural product biosynthesis protein [Streptomyces sp. NPDC012769]|uniref:DUF6415 family natural product biosynthesis protein n=1 Tax=Streptomyces sp. NPDC012769 TaxID=3364848 RepID=UPI0036ACBC91